MLTPWRVPPKATRIIERVREIYNEALPLLATKPIPTRTYDEQQDWWQSVDHEKVRLYVYMNEPGDIVGFALLTDRGNTVTPMVAIAAKHRDRGYGQEIMRHYLDAAKPKPMICQSLVENKAINMLNVLMGWQLAGRKGDVFTYYHPNGTEDIDEIQP